MTVQEYNNTVDMFSDRVYRFILKCVKDTDHARDIVQDSYERLWINVRDIGYEKARSYLFTTAYRRMIDLIRKENSHKNYESNSRLAQFHSEQYTDVKEILNKALALLPENQKSVVLLRDYEGYSYEEISEITGLAESQVKVYIFRARKFLKEYIGKIEYIV